MDIYIVSSVYHFSQLMQKKEKDPVFADELARYIFITRDWFVEKEIQNAGYDVDILDNHCSKTENKNFTKQEMKELDTWFVDETGNDFSLYKGISLADSSTHHFYHDFFTQIFHVVPNVLKLIDLYQPRKIIYEYHIFYRECIYFDSEDLLLDLICGQKEIEFECVYTDLSSDIDKEKFDQMPALRRKKDFITGLLTVDDKKARLFDMFNSFQLIKHKILRKVKKNKLCVFTDANRGVGDFQREHQKDYLFVMTRKPKDVMDNIVNTILLLKGRIRTNRKEVDEVIKKWNEFIYAKEAGKYVYCGIDLTVYIKREVEWAINNLFPLLMERVDKALSLFQKINIDIIITQADTTIDYKYIFGIAKKLSIKNYVHPDGPRDLIEFGARFADYVMLYSDGSLNDYRSEGARSRLFVTGNPPFQTLCRNIELNWNSKLSQDRPRNILITLKNDGPFVVGNYWSSSVSYIENVLKGIFPVKEYCNVTVRSYPGRSRFLRLLKGSYFKDHDFQIQVAEEIPFLAAVKDCDIFIGIPSTTVFEAALMGKVVIHYNNENMFHYPPFDGSSEVAYADSPEELTGILENIFKSDYSEYLYFNKHEIIEKYTGPLEKPDSIELINDALCM